MNKAIVIGTDHINTLGVIRNLGENHVNVEVIIISQKKRVAVVKSKYVKKFFIIDHEDLLTEFLINKYKNECKKPVIITTTDSIALEIDNNFNILKDYFLMPSISDNKKNINYYMDKYNQYKLAIKNKVRMANSFLYSLKSDNKIEVNYPIIIKPYISALGNKEDIRICKNDDELKVAKKYLMNNCYDVVLIQEFIKYDTEFDLVGFVYEGKVEIPGIIVKKNIWPSGKGSTTYGLVVPTNNYKKEINAIKAMIKDIGYEGIFDIEFFLKSNELYFNEINFRNGALSYAYGEANICFNYYKSVVNNKVSNCKKIDKDYYFVDDNAHLHNIFDKDISFKQYFQHIKKSRIKLAYNSNDKKPWFFMVIYKIINKVFK